MLMLLSLPYELPFQNQQQQIWVGTNIPFSHIRLLKFQTTVYRFTPFIINVHRRRLWKADFSLATLAKGPHLVLCFVMVANNANAPTANRSAFFKNFIRLRSYHRI
jgi:hypothetical protein